MNIRIEQSKKDEQWYVTYEGENHQTFAVSEGYTREDSALRGVRDFFESLGRDGFIQNGVMGFNVGVRIIDKDGTVLRDMHGPVDGR